MILNAYGQRQVVDDDVFLGIITFYHICSVCSIGIGSRAVCSFRCRLLALSQYFSETSHCIGTRAQGSVRAFPFCVVLGQAHIDGASPRCIHGPQCGDMVCVADDDVDLAVRATFVSDDMAAKHNPAYTESALDLAVCHWTRQTGDIDPRCLMGRLAPFVFCLAGTMSGSVPVRFDTRC